MNNWYLIDDGSGIPCALEAETPLAAIEAYYTGMVGGIEGVIIREVWRGNATTQHDSVVQVSEVTAKQYDGTKHWPDISLHLAEFHYDVTLPTDSDDV